MEALDTQTTDSDNPAKLITDNLDIWTAAIKTRSASGRGSSKKLDLYGIKKLRELILELAVRGKLVPQDPNDEPASVLLEHIAHEKAQRFKEGKLKPAKTLPEVTGNEKSFDLPQGWEWVRFGHICEIERGGSPRPIKSFLTDDPDGLNWIKIGDTDIGGKYITSTNEKIRKEGLKKTRKVYPGDFLLTNSMSFGRPYITKIEGCIHDGWLRISPPDSLDKDYLYNLLSSPYVMRSFKNAAAGAVVMNLNADKVRIVCILLPPLAEQHRIVAKVDELMALCDQLEQQTEASIDAHATLVETLLKTLTDSADAAELEQNWARIADHFDTLFTTDQSIDQLKQTVLQLAVMGKLVPQDPNDEPVARILERIEDHRSEREKNKEIQKHKKVTAPNVLNACMPDSSQAVLLNDLVFVTKLAGFEYTKYINLEETGEVPVIRAQNVRPFKPSLANLKYIDLEASESLPRSALDRPSLLITFIGAGIGDVCVFNMPERWHLAPNVAKVEPFADLNIEYLCLYLNSPIGRAELFKSMKSTAQPSLSMTTIREIWVVTPPIEEQHRIVAKVDQLMNLCDQLKARLQKAQKTQLHLADALVEQAVE